MRAYILAGKRHFSDWLYQLSQLTCQLIGSLSDLKGIFTPSFWGLLISYIKVITSLHRETGIPLTLRHLRCSFQRVEVLVIDLLFERLICRMQVNVMNMSRCIRRLLFSHKAELFGARSFGYILVVMYSRTIQWLINMLVKRHQRPFVLSYNAPNK